MKDINFDFKQLQAFLAVIETGSLPLRQRNST